MLERCHDRARDAGDLRAEFGIGEKTLQGDLAYLRRHFPGQFEESRFDGRKSYRWTGLPIAILDEPPGHLDHRELVALIAARGLLRRPADGTPVEGRGDDYDGLLDGAIDRLLRRCGLDAEAARIAPDAIQVSRFAALVEPPEHLDAAIAAVVTGDLLAGDYTNLDGATKPVHLRPVRLVLIDGEWLLLANDGRREPPVKNYRLARFGRLRRTRRELPAGAPAHVPQIEADAHLDAAFRAHGSTDPADRRRVVLAIAPAGIPHVRGRTWGADQHWEDAPADLPAGWARLRFVTTGVPACRHWVLSLGALARAEEPPELLAWLREQAEKIAGYYGRSRPPAAMSKTPAGTGGKNRRTGR